MLRYTVWSAEETAENFLCEGAVGGITHEAGSLGANKLVVEILKLALEKALNLHCNIPITAFKRTLDEESGAKKRLIQTTKTHCPYQKTDHGHKWMHCTFVFTTTGSHCSSQRSCLCTLAG